MLLMKERSQAACAGVTYVAAIQTNPWKIVSAMPKRLHLLGKGAVLGSEVFGSVAFVPILRAKWKPKTPVRDE